MSKRNYTIATQQEKLLADFYAELVREDEECGPSEFNFESDNEDEDDIQSHTEKQSRPSEEESDQETDIEV